MEKFDLVVENKMSGTTIMNHKLELNSLTWPNDSPPDVVIMPGGLILVRVGKYLSEGERYSYRVADVAHLVGGRLEQK
jgi:hypothetical protein